MEAHDQLDISDDSSRDEEYFRTGVDPEYITNAQLNIPEEIADFGDLLRTYRQNHGYSILQLSKMIGIPPQDISMIELSKKDLPPEPMLRTWLHKLGCGRVNTQKTILLSRQYRVKHWISLNRKEKCNPDLLRLLEAYRSEKLSDYDKALMKLIAR